MFQSNSDLAISDTGVAFETLQEAISEEYRFVIEDPRDAFHFHTGRPLPVKLDYPEEWLAKVRLTALVYQARGHMSPSLAMASR